MKYSLGDKRVKLLGSGHFIAPNAAVIGDVTLHEKAACGSVARCAAMRTALR